MLIVTLVVLGVSKFDASYPPDSLTKVEDKLTLSSKEHRWIFETRVTRRWDESGRFINRFVRATCDRKLAWREEVGLDHPKKLPSGNFMKFSRPKVKAPWEIVAIRG